MLIDSYSETWLEQLEQRLTSMADATNMFLFFDGVFIPGLFRAREFGLSQTCSMSLLFETLPACSEETRDVSPFLVSINRLNRSLSSMLGRCSGWPMISAIETTESLTDLSRRLAAWCIVEADDQRFNLRFPDTRRLPKIFGALTLQQRAQMTGPMSRWSFIGRDGNWEHLNIDGNASVVATQPALDEEQFGILVNDSEPDEVLLQLAYRGFEPVGRPSVNYASVRMALRVADEGKLSQQLRCDWCEFILNHEKTLNESDATSCLAAWRITPE